MIKIKAHFHSIPSWPQGTKHIFEELELEPDVL